MSGEQVEQRAQVDDVVTFDGKRTRWLARAHSDDGRHTLLTAPMFGKVFYSIIDWRRSMRGPMNVIGWGLGIDTPAGGLVPVQRPNGKWYLPERPPVQIEFTDLHQEIGYIAVLRTHDVAFARGVARPVNTAHLVTPEDGRQLIWLAHTKRDGEDWWEYDDRRGVPAVLFEESDDTEEAANGG